MPSLAALALIAAFGLAGDPPGTGAARPLELVYESGIFEGTCALVHAEPQDGVVVLYFVTSARLFKTAQGEPLRPARAIRVTLADGRVVNIQHDGVFLPAGNLVDVAVLRASAPPPAGTPASLAFDAPEPDDDFVIAGSDRDGAELTVSERVRFVSTRLVVGDRDASALVGCLGAPAISADGIYGVVSECDANRAPVVTLLSAAYAFIARHVPGLAGRPTLKEQP
jgi:hypothetical protein